jgi:peptide/nickel transport system permease protein
MMAAWHRWTKWLAEPLPQSRRQAQAGRLYRAAEALLRNRLAALGLAFIALLIFSALFAPILTFGQSPYQQDLPERLAPPSGAHWLGTDELGRDLYTRLLYGARITLMIITLVSLVVVPIGLAVGTTAAYFGGWIDTVLSRVIDVFLAFPRLILALAFVAALGPGIGNAVLAITLTSWPSYARIARVETQKIRRSDFIQAAVVLGASPAHILFGSIASLCLTSMVIRLTLDMAGIIVTAAGLGFLGLGAQPPTPEWGAMVAAGRAFILDQWWIATIPGAAILSISLAFNFLGDGLRDILDPRSL